MAVDAGGAVGGADPPLACIVSMMLTMRIQTMPPRNAKKPIGVSEATPKTIATHPSHFGSALANDRESDREPQHLGAERERQEVVVPQRLQRLHRGRLDVVGRLGDRERDRAVDRRAERDDRGADEC